MWLLIFLYMQSCTAATVPVAEVSVMSRRSLLPGQDRGPDIPGFHREDPDSSLRPPLVGGERRFGLLASMKTIDLPVATDGTKHDRADTEAVSTGNLTLESGVKAPMQQNFTPEATITTQGKTGTPTTTPMSLNTISIPSNVMHTLADAKFEPVNGSNGVIAAKSPATKPPKRVPKSKIVTSPKNNTSPPKTEMIPLKNSTTAAPKDAETELENVASPPKKDLASNPCKILEIQVDANDTSAAHYHVQLIVVDEKKCQESSHIWWLYLIEVETRVIKHKAKFEKTFSCIAYGRLEGEYQLKTEDETLASNSFRLSHKEYVPVAAFSNQDDFVEITLILSELVSLDDVDFELGTYPCNSSAGYTKSINKGDKLKFYASKEHCTPPKCFFRFKGEIRRPACSGETSFRARIGKDGQYCFPFLVDDDSTIAIPKIPVSPTWSITYTALVSVLAVLGIIAVVVSCVRLRKTMIAVVTSDEFRKSTGWTPQEKVEVLLIYRKKSLDQKLIEDLSLTLMNQYNCQVNDLFDLKDPAKHINCNEWIEGKVKASSSVRMLFIVNTAKSSNPGDDLVHCILKSSLVSRKEGLSQEDQWYLFALRCVRDAKLTFTYERVFVAVSDDGKNSHLKAKNADETEDDLDAKKPLIATVDSNDKDTLKTDVGNASEFKDDLWFMVPHVRYNLGDPEHVRKLGQDLQRKKDVSTEEIRT